MSVVSTTPNARKRVIDYIVKSTNSIGELLLLYFALIVLSGLAFAWFEHRSIGEGLWWAVVTTTTTGYGDFSPATLAGRLMGAATMLISLLIVLPLLIGHIAARLIEDHDAFTHEEQEMLKAEIIALRADLAKLAASRASES